MYLSKKHLTNFSKYKTSISKSFDKFSLYSIPDGKFVTTEAGKSKDHKYIIHAVSPYFEDYNGNIKEAQEKLSTLIQNMFEFCGEKGVDSIALPPMGSGICMYPTDVCSKAFFEGIMNYLDKCDLKSSLKEISICIIEQDKCTEFTNEWEKRYNEKFPEGEMKENTNSSGSDSDKSRDDSDDDDEEDKDADFVNKFAHNQNLPKSNAFVKKDNNLVKRNRSSSSDDEPASLKKPSDSVVKKFAKDVDSDSSDDDKLPKASFVSKGKKYLR